ncbi:MAG TPA: DUF4916 domain-containing protein [Pseudoclavibacter sp.]|nr:DUF4916 domain-containing protein [Pseudoclavibacter sp.]
MSFVGTPDPDSGWLSDDDFAIVRRQLPILYVEAVPVRVDGRGVVTDVGLLLRVSSAGAMTRTLVSGRVMHGELVRDALLRHLEKDLGPMAFPQIPLSATPATVAEYFPPPSESGLVDPRQHAVSLVYVVPVTGTCDPRQDALELSWLSPPEALSPSVLADLEGGRGQVVARALAAVGISQ